MGLLAATRSARTVRLASRVRVGRDPGCGVRLSHPSVSGEHALIEHLGGCWSLRDLGSRNGTRVDGRLVAPGARVALQEGSVVVFGVDTEPWRVEEAGPPRARARCASGGEELVGGPDFLALPDPTCSAMRDAEGGWRLERGGQVQAVEDGAEVEVGGVCWTLHLPALLVPTWEACPDGPRMDRATFRFTVSLDEETVRLVVSDGPHELDLGVRAGHYHLLTLARLRLEQAEHEATGEAGWVEMDRLTRMLHADDNQVNVYLHRARRQLSKAGLTGAAEVVERRAGRRLLRFGTTRVEVVRGQPG